MPNLGFGQAAINEREGYGLAMKQAIKDGYGMGMGISFTGRGSMVPNNDSYCEIDPDVKDKWGTPVLRFHWKWSDDELNQARHMRESFRALIETMGGTVNAPGAGRGGAAGGRGAGAAGRGGGAARALPEPARRLPLRRGRPPDCRQRRPRRHRPTTVRSLARAAGSFTKWAASA